MTAIAIGEGKRLASAKDLFLLFVVAVVVIAGRLPSAGAREGVARALGWAAHLLSREKRRRVGRAAQKVDQTPLGK